MPLQQKIFKFLLAIILFGATGKARELEEILGEISHDAWNRLLNGDWDVAQKLMELARRWIPSRGGYFILDHMVV